jgi:6-phosphogluconate dehydrogenase (decarboxylating)
MGAHMAKNLLKKKYKVIVFDVNTDAVSALKEAGKSSGICVLQLWCTYMIIGVLNAFLIFCCGVLYWTG